MVVDLNEGKGSECVSRTATVRLAWLRNSVSEGWDVASMVSIVARLFPEAALKITRLQGPGSAW